MHLIDKLKDRIAALRHRRRSREEADAIINKSIGAAMMAQQKRSRRGRGTRSLAIALSVLMSASAFMASALTVSADDTDFEAFMESEWKSYMEDDYPAMHSSVKDYHALGLTKPKVTFGDIGYAEFEKEVKESQASLAKLRSFDPDSLDDKARHDYLVFEEYLECLIGMYSHPDLQEMFRPVTGKLTSVKEFCEDFAFYTKEDVEDYLVLLADLPRYIDQMTEFTTQQAAKGYFMDDLSAQDAIDEMEDFVDAGEENELIVVFENSVDELSWLSDSEKADYKAKVRQIVLDKVIPAYTKAQKALTGLIGSRKYGNAVCDYPDGTEYYTCIARYYCSSNDTLEEKFDFLSDCIREALDHYRKLLQDNPSFDEPGTIEGLDSLDDVIDYLRDHMEGFPKGPNVRYKLAYLDESVAEEAMAYYVPAPVDDINENIIHVNGDAVDDINTLYFTLAHEGFPGHLYQLTWYQDTGISGMRHDIAIMGYEEGWANYVERIMLKRSPLDEVSAEFIACDEFISYMLNAASDIAVNGLGYNEKELGDWFAGLGLDREFGSEMYEYMIQNPYMLLPYGYGEARFWELDGRTRNALAEDFDEEEYHLQLLTNGQRQFELVEQDVRAYVESKGKTLPDDTDMFADEAFTESAGGSTVLFSNRLLIAAGILILAAAVILLARRRKKHAETIKDEDSE